MGKSVDKTPLSTDFSTPLSARSSKLNDHAIHGSFGDQATQASKALPLSILYTEKFHLLDDGVWRKREPDKRRALFGRVPAAVELLNAEGASRFNIAGGLTDNSTFPEGQRIPKEIIAVVRPKSIIQKKGHTNGRTDQQSIVPDEMEMILEVKVYDFAPPETDVLKAGKELKVVYSGKTKATMKQDVQGLYCFSTSGNQLEHLFAQMGTYLFHFSLVSSKYGEVPPAVVRVNVAPSNANMCNSLCLERPKDYQHRKRRSRRHKHSSGSVDIAPVEEDIEEEDLPMPQIENTQIHVTTLDVVVSVNGFFAIAVFLGLAFSPPLPQFQAATTLAPARLECYVQINVYRAVVLWEVVSFSCFLFSTLVAHGFKLYIVLENGRDKENSKFAEVNQRFLRFGILSSSVGSILGAIFLIVSMVVLIEVRLGDLFCGNPWAVNTTVPFVIMGVSGCAIFIVAVFYEAFKSYKEPVDAHNTPHLDS